MVCIEIDGRVGGSFSSVQWRDGEKIEHTGEYLESVRPRCLVLTWAILQDSPDSNDVIIDIVPLKLGSEPTVTHELHPHWALRHFW